MRADLKLIFITINLFITLSTAIALTACNGGSTTSEISYPRNSIVQLDDEQHINQSVDLILYYPNDSLSNIRWQQTAGEPVTILAKSSKVIAFTPTQAGEYSFSASFMLNESLEQTLEKSIIVTENHHKITARLSHSVLAENNVSFRSELDSNLSSSTLKWQQIAGPTVTLTTENSDGELAIFFDAPQVNVDTLIVFEVLYTDADNITHSDQVAVLVEPADAIASNAYFSDRKATVFVYNQNSPYADELTACVYSNSLSSSCTLAQVPLLAEEIKNSNVTLSIESIMDRVIVSHQWMGDRFKDFLINNDSHDDIKNLLRATTAIVIAYDIRPSFYWAATGAIYLDAENLWLTTNERDTINEAADFRADFGSDLQFVMPWRYVKNNSYASNSYSQSTRVNRTADDSLYRLAALLYHELAHANDFFPSNEWYIHSSEQRILDAATSSSFESDELDISSPLASQEMRNLAQVSFSGETANATQKSYLPADISGFFSSDRASDYYAYSSLREDFAMLFEELMMQHRFGVLRDIAVTNQPTGDYITATDYSVTWGQRGRIGDNNIRDRVEFSASRVLPEFDSQQAIDSVPTPIEMVAGDNWVDNLTISASEDNISGLLKTLDVLSIASELTHLSSAETVPVNKGIRYYQKALPSH
ncbi:MAG: hypothetical protein V5789_11900 [Colwellia sp.]